MRSVTLPSTAIATPSTPFFELAALRFTLEWPEQVELYQVLGDPPLNMQSFVVVIDGPVVAQDPPSGPQ